MTIYSQYMDDVVGGKIIEIAACPDRWRETKYAKYIDFCVQLEALYMRIPDPANVYFVAKEQNVEVDVTALVKAVSSLALNSLASLVLDDLKFDDDLDHGYNGRV